MDRKFNRLLIIPARGGSKRIKNKNIKLFNRKPIIYYPIREAIKSKLFSTIHVTTDSLKIYNAVSKINRAICFYRPANLATDKTPLMEVFRYVVKFYKKKKIMFNEIWFSNPCSPLIVSKDLKKAAKQFCKQKNNSLLSVSQYSPSLDWAFYKKKNILVPINRNAQIKPSKDLKQYYYDTGNFGIFSKDVFYNKKKPLFSGYEIPRNRAVDIDNIDDWNLALKLSK